MSRRHAPTLTTRPHTRVFGAALALLLAAAALLPAAAAAQDDSIKPRDLQWEWQLLTQRDPSGSIEPVPPGVGATLLLRSEVASGEAACSTFDSSYSTSANGLNVFVEPEEIEWRECDPDSRAFDDAFYENLRQISFIERADDVLEVRDAVGGPLMTFTRATIDNDPTASRWTLARIGDADGSVQPTIDGLTAWMEFLRGGSLVGSTGCGSFLGKYETNQGRIDITDVVSRLGACPSAGALAQAERILATLDDVTDFQVRPAGLALADELGTTRLAFTPDLDLGGRTWTPTAIYDEGGRLRYGSGNELTTSAVKFFSNVYQGRSICRPFAGKALRSGLAISVGRPEFIGLPKLCRSRGDLQLDQVELAFVTALEDAASHALRGDELTLTDVNGITRAVLEPQPPLTGTTWVVTKLRKGKRMVNPSGDIDITATFEDIDAQRVGLVTGKTGVSNRRDENRYFGTFKTPQATRIEVGQLNTGGNGCEGNRAKSKACQDEKIFLRLLAAADTYIALDDSLKLNKGSRNLILFREERLELSDE